MIATLILAAGSSKSPSNDTVSADVAGRPLLDWTLEFVTRTVPAATCFVVVGPRQAPLVTLPGVNVTVVDDAAVSRSHGLGGALRALPLQFNGALVVLGDDPVAALALPLVHATAMRAPDALVGVKRPSGEPHPAYLPRWVWPQQAQADDGLTHILDQDTLWLTPEGLPEPVGVDIPDRLERLAALLAAEAGAR